MNTIPAQGAPGSLIRKFQEEPVLGVELLECCRAATGAYAALKSIGADLHIPGYQSCVDELDILLTKFEGMP